MTAAVTQLPKLRAKHARRTAVACAVMAVVALASTLTALALGDFTLSLPDVITALVGGGDSATHTVVVEWRLPRALSALIFGAALGVSGGIFQSLTRNALASPDVVGLSTGSYTGAMLALLVTGAGGLGVTASSVLGGLATAALVYFLAYKRGVQGFRLIVVGIAVSAVLDALTSYVMLKARLDAAMSASIWGVGSLDSVGLSGLTISGTVVAASLIACAWVAPSLRELALGDDLAVGHGVRLTTTWVVAVVAGVALTSAVTAAAGPIAFVSLVAPQIARRITGEGGIGLASSACLGAALLSLADLVAGHAFAAPLPVGLLTVVMGGAYLLWMLVSSGGAKGEGAA